MAQQSHNTHQAVYHAGGIPRQFFLHYLSSILQNLGISGKLAQLATKMGHNLTDITLGLWLDPS